LAPQAWAQQPPLGGQSNTVHDPVDQHLQVVVAVFNDERRVPPHMSHDATDLIEASFVTVGVGDENMHAVNPPAAVGKSRVQSFLQQGLPFLGKTDSVGANEYIHFETPDGWRKQVAYTP
jgi:hypothetical protein